MRLHPRLFVLGVRMDQSTFDAWLRQPGAQRVVLVEAMADVGGVETAVFLSSREFASAPDDVPANQPYLAVVDEGVSLTDRLQLDLSGSGMSWGDIRLNNLDGRLDGLLGYVWRQRAVKVLLGDGGWPRRDFWPVFSGVVEDIDSSERGQLALKLRDPLQRLNAPVTEVKLGGATANKDRLLPLAFGHVFNLTPLLVNPSLHEYRVHQGAVSQIVEVRDQGLPVSFTTAGLGPGLFRLNQRPFGEVTADVVATVEAAGTAPALIRLLATQYGQVTERFAAAEIDGANFSAMAALCPQPVGLYLSDRENVLAVCQQLAASVGCMLQVSRAGQLRLVRLAAGGVPVAALTPSGYVLGSDKITSRPAVEAAVQLGYAKNWSEQNSGLAGGVPEAHKTLYGAQWQQATKSDAAVAARWRLHTEPVQVDTLLVRRVDADAEARRRLNMARTVRHVVQAQFKADFLGLQSGDAVTLTMARWGLHVGVTGLVVEAQPNWLTGRTTLSVLIWQDVPADVSAPGSTAGLQHDTVRALQVASPRVDPVYLPGNVIVPGSQVSGALGGSVTINGSQIYGGINASALFGTVSTSLLQADVVKASTINTYSLSANQITSGTINTSLLQADVLRVYSQLNASNITSGSISTSLLQADVARASNLGSLIGDINLLTVNDLYSRRGLTAQNFFHCYGLFGVSGASWFSGDVHLQRNTYAEGNFYLRNGGEALEAWQSYVMEIDGQKKNVTIHR